ncbi:DUF1778 domain-containing protein [Bacillus sp. NP157]|nr:DUF1778 domain-containing protein [Bacillus sp. NP157]
MTAKDFDAFTDLLQSPPSPGPKLRDLLSRMPVWKK